MLFFSSDLDSRLHGSDDVNFLVIPAKAGIQRFNS